MTEEQIAERVAAKLTGTFYVGQRVSISEVGGSRDLCGVIKSLDIHHTPNRLVVTTDNGATRYPLAKHVHPL